MHFTVEENSFCSDATKMHYHYRDSQRMPTQGRSYEGDLIDVLFLMLFYFTQPNTAYVLS